MKSMIACLAVSAAVQCFGAYEKTWESLDARPVPAWWQDAKLGIFIHWGPYAVPAYAPYDKGNIYACYAEWYHGRWLKGHEAFRAHHAKHYQNAPIGNFAAQFTARHFDPAKWADLFVRAGAKYVVLTSKHHDGYALWPSAQSPYFNSVALGSGRDLAGELTRAMKAAGLKSGFYYSLLEYANPNYPHAFRYGGPKTEGADAKTWSRTMNLPQMKELVEKYEADIIWTDGEWDLTDEELLSVEFLHWLYTESKMRETVVVNDRWGKKCRGRHGGHYCTEYGHSEGLDKAKTTAVHPWEECRGIGRSFGYNRFETTAQYMSGEELVHLFVRIISGGGNLLLNIGPDAEGLIPPIMEDRLLQLGAWIAANAEAVYGSRARAAGPHSCGKTLFFTEKPAALYAISTVYPAEPIRIPGAAGVKNVTILGQDVRVDWRAEGDALVVSLPAGVRLEGRYAWTFRLAK